MLPHGCHVVIDALAAHGSASEELKSTLLRQSMGRFAAIRKVVAMGNEDALEVGQAAASARSLQGR